MIIIKIGLKFCLIYNKNMQKELIKTRFKKSIKTYNDNAIVQKKMAINLVKYLGKNKYNSIVELGCGTGFIAEELTKNFNFSNYYAIDLVEDCKKYLSNISKDINFICDDIEKVNLSEYNPDLIISNAALQWIENLPEFIEKLMTNLNPKGQIAFTIFGEENYKELDKIIPNKIKYYSLENLKNIFKNYKIFTLKEEKNILKFNTPKEVLYHIKYTGVNAINSVSWTISDLKIFEKKYNEICDKNITLTYHSIYVVLED